jgi:hypothetical protein
MATMKRSSWIRGLVAVAVMSLITAACSGDDDADPTATPAVPPTTAATTAAEPSATAIAATPSPAPASPVPTATPDVGAGAGLEALSLVYVDTRRGQGGDIYIADADGSNSRLLLSDPSYSRALDVAGNTLAAVAQNGLLFVSLASGKPSPIDESERIFDGRFFDQQTFFYSVTSGCPEGGGTLFRVELPEVEPVELVTSDFSLSIVGVDLATNTIAIVPRGCDVGIASMEVYDALTGQLRNTLAVEGCGWAIAALDQGKAITSWQSCTQPLNHTGAHATVYDFGIVGPTGRDITVPVVDPNAMPWLRRPGHAEVVFGTTTSLGAGPGRERSGGIYTLGLANRQFGRLVDGEGAEQYPVAWSPDGRYLLYAVVEAQGVCHYAYIDAGADNPEPVAINPDITICGVNGEVVGWTELP